MQWALDSQGEAIHLSKEWLNFSDLSHSTRPETTFYEVIHPADVVPAKEIIERSTSNAAPFILTCRQKRLASDYSWVMVGGTPAHDQIDGSLLGYLGSTKLLEAMTDPLHVGDLLRPSMHDGATHDSRVLGLDAAAHHLIQARKFVLDAGDRLLQQLLDVVLIEVGHKLFKATRPQ